MRRVVLAVMLGVVLSGCASVQGAVRQVVHPCPPANLWNITWSPDGAKIAYNFEPYFEAPQLRIIDLATGEVRILAENVFSFSWSPDGHKLLVSDHAGFSYSVVNIDDSTIQKLPDYIEKLPVSWSPDGEQIATVKLDRTTYLWHLGIYDLKQESWNELVTSSIELGSTVWSPDGKQLAFAQQNGTSTDLMAIDVMSHESVVLLSGDYSIFLWPVWSPDGLRIALIRRFSEALHFTIIEADGSQDIALDIQTDAYEGEFMWLTDNSGFISNKHGHGDPSYPVTVFKRNLEGQLEELLDLTDLADSGTTSPVAISPDASRVAFTSSDLGYPDLYVMNIDGMDKQRLTVNPGYSTCFSWPF